MGTKELHAPKYSAFCRLCPANHVTTQECTLVQRQQQKGSPLSAEELQAWIDPRWMIPVSCANEYQDVANAVEVVSE
ncbi:hypothetical protein A2363_02930 [Candidatus Gottesmanbacteria bacterium RIFOXYB1_FULL_47_11]|uniref:Uncharacterized protein n=1 Tax=Candidatus Gottesmanbacteria bacterium RIFOXYB1_FULL_47_11 TaxID=1798401 RepID=A0A1F6BCD9_9BACT|nr:MAG: hypothetical protein A2363_02930 [Candidatus Gottesmanbacteria bacterium RIFOXYB1_FULL_47_11]